MKSKVCIISCYMGKLPEYFKAFLITCRYNKDFNWIIITDDETQYNIPDNVKILRMKLDDVAGLIRAKIGDWAILPSAYKLCDYKVAYGLIFEDYLTGYTHWGYGDIDVIYGKLNKFITDDKLDFYDKIFPLGHLSILKNNESCKRAFMADTDNTLDYRNVYRSGHAFYFDENNGINEKMAALGMKLYLDIDFIDISSIYSRMRNVTGKEVSMLLPGCKLRELSYPQNFGKQIYVWDEGKLLRYIYDKEITSGEYVYMHFRRNLETNIAADVRRFIIGKSKIEELNRQIDKNTISEHNGGAIFDIKDLTIFLIKRYVPKIRYTVTASAAKLFYSIKPIRLTVQKIKKLMRRENNE